MTFNNFNYSCEQVTKKEMCLYILFGLFAFSPISSYLVMTVLHFPMSLPEVFVIFFLPFLPKDFKKCFTFNKGVFVKNSIFLIVLLFIGMLYGNYSNSELLGTTRIYLDLIFYFSISNKQKGPNLKIIYFIALGTIIGWLFMSIINLRTFFLVSDEGGFVSLGNTFAIPLGMVAALLLKDNKKFFIYIVAALLVCLMSLVRRPLVILFCSLFIPFLFGLYGRKAKRVMFFIVILVGLLLPSLSIYLEKEYPIIYRRTFEKTIEFIHGESNQDDDYRKENLASFSLFDNIIPRGLVTRNTEKPDGGLYIDYPFYEYFYTFGLFAFYFVARFMFKIRSLYILYKKTYDSYIYLIMFMCLVIILLSFLEGTFLSSTYIVPMTGFIFGQIRYFTHLNTKRLRSGNV